MAEPELDAIRNLIKAGDRAAARQQLRPLLQDPATPKTPELYVAAARACESDEAGRLAAIRLLRQALALDMHHNEANRLLMKIEGERPMELLLREAAEATTTRAQLAQAAQKRATALPPPDVPLKRARRERKPISPWRAMGCTALIILGMSCSFLTMNMVGVISGGFTVVNALTGGPTPIGEWEGVPLDQLVNPALVLPSSQEQRLEEGRDVDVLDPGFTHEYDFAARRGEEIAIYVQFLSLAANNVSRNIAVVRPDGSEANASCQRDRILQEDNNLVYICNIDQDGTWYVRIVGRSGESVGIYFVGVERM